ncbi:helix-turn-helix domain-containing protein [Natrinema sp. 1APR25-10V2]|uniref:TrmB family transcriptional regulator n=1 Tax=Natrinema sp. 1APR25-10V2 TaxID=2951081 RepID=UPI0028769FC8|nr:helix-turn-helix domain-containing protein [Natrinema sp. 1APR25-10V2]MDS0473907.1 TrmB family transcriptional regulator [Natrinema sp. 1APR25-10V2]
MTRDETIQEAIDLLQDLGLQEYEARCFVALNQLPSGTAKEIHDVSEVPRTRVYDAVSTLESEGLVEVQHSNPQVYRAVDIEEATQTLRRKYADRIDSLETHLENAEVQETDEENHVQEVWSMVGNDAIESRMLELIDGAESEIALVVVDESILSETLFEELGWAVESELTVLLGGKTDAITSRFGTELPTVRVFETSLDWLTGAMDEDEVAISRIMLVDREKLLIGSYYPAADDAKANEQAVFASGLENGIVVLLRRLITVGLSAEDPAD